jgi:hypothetical protein
MRLLSIDLRRPTFGDITAMALTATLLLVSVLAVCAMAGYHPGTYTKGVFLACLAWGSFTNLIGIRVQAGWRHFVLMTAGCVVINAAAIAIASFHH